METWQTALLGGLVFVAGAVIKGFIDQYIKRKDDLETRITDEKLDRIMEALSHLEQGMAEVKKELVKLSTSGVLHDERIADHEKRLSKIEERVDQLSRDLTACQLNAKNKEK